MPSNNKDRKAKKREADAKLRQHVDEGVTEVLSSTDLIIPASAQSLLSASNPRDAAALHFIQQQQQRQQQAEFMNTNNNNSTATIGAALQQYNGGEDDDEDVAEANRRIDDARLMALVTGTGTDNNNKSNNTNANNKDKDGDANNGGGAPKRKRFRQEEMKLALEKALGPKGVRLVPHIDEDTGNAVEPFVCVQLKANTANVPVPAHWRSVSAYLSNQTDRPLANVILPEVKASGVAFARSGLNQKFDVSLFAKAFLSPNPLQLKTYNLRLMDKKGQHYEGTRWKPTTTVTPGKISEELRKALGMLSQNSPPPWIHNMQRVKTLPPSYPNASYPGLNAPLPEGGQWGCSRGQWGEPVRTADRNFMYPASQSLGNTTSAAAASSSSTANAAAAGRVVAAAPFGTVPPRRRITDDADNDNANAKGAATTIVNSAAAVNKPAPSVVPVSYSAAAAAAAASTRLPIASSVQLDQYLMAIAADDEDDLLSAGARLVSRRAVQPGGAAGAAAVGGVSTVSLTPSLGM